MRGARRVSLGNCTTHLAATTRLPKPLFLLLWPPKTPTIARQLVFLPLPNRPQCREPARKRIPPASQSPRRTSLISPSKLSAATRGSCAVAFNGLRVPVPVFVRLRDAPRPSNASPVRWFANATIPLDDARRATAVAAMFVKPPNPSPLALPCDARPHPPVKIPHTPPTRAQGSALRRRSDPPFAHAALAFWIAGPESLGATVTPIDVTQRKEGSPGYVCVPDKSRRRHSCAVPFRA